MRVSKREEEPDRVTASRSMWCVVALGVLLLVFVPAARAQQKPCCSVTKIDGHTGLVSAKVYATGLSFEFRVTNPVLANLLHVGQGVYANFQTKQVSLDGKNVAGTIVAIGQAPPSSPGKAPSAQAGTAQNLSGLVMHPRLTAGTGFGMAPCGAGQIPDVAGPIAPSTGPLDPLSAANELQAIAWTNFSKQITCDAVSQLLAEINHNLAPPSNKCNDALQCWNFGAVIQDVRPEMDIAASPGVRYACLSQQDCPSGVAPGFALDVPLKGPGWKVGVSAQVGYTLHAEQDYKNPLTGEVHKIKDLLNCGFHKQVDVTLSNIRISTTTTFSSPVDLSRPTISQASVKAHLALNLEGAIYTNGPQDLTLSATVSKSGQMTFANPTPIAANVNLIDVCGVAELPAHMDNLGITLAWEPGQQQVTAKIFGTLVVEILGRTIAVRQPIEMAQALRIPPGLLQAFEQGLPRPWGENPPSQFWTQAADASVDFGATAKQIESAILPHIPWGAVLSIDHSAPPLPNTRFGVATSGQPLPQRFGYLCPPSPTNTAAGGKFAMAGVRLGGASACYRLEYDSAIHTGEYLTAEAFRYAATHSLDALTRIKEVLNGNDNGIARLFWVTEDAAVSKDGKIVVVMDKPGLFSRTAFPSDSPLPLGDSPTGTVPGYHNCYFMRPEGGWNVGRQHYATLGDIPPALLAQLQFSTYLSFGGVPQENLIQPVGRIWYGLGCGEGEESPLSRDQYVGTLMGLAYTHALVPDPDVQKTTSDLITKALAFLIKNNWDVRVPPDRRIPLDSHFLRSWDGQLGFLRIGASVNPTAVMPNGATLGHLYHIYAAGSKLSWIPIWATMMEPLTGGGFAANLSHAVIGPTLFLETDPALRQNFMLWYNVLRRGTQHHKNAYFNAVSMLDGGLAPSQRPSPSNPNLTLQEELKGILQEWLKRRDEVNAGNGLPLTFVGDPSYQANLFNGSGVAFYTALTGEQRYLAKYALPIYARNGDGLDFAWQRDPFDIAVGPPSTNPPAGCSAQLGSGPAQTPFEGGFFRGTVVTASQIFYCGSEKFNQEAPGVDYLLPYWMAVYLKLLPPPAP